MFQFKIFPLPLIFAKINNSNSNNDNNNNSHNDSVIRINLGCINENLQTVNYNDIIKPKKISYGQFIKWFYNTHNNKFSLQNCDLSLDEAVISNSYNETYWYNILNPDIPFNFSNIILNQWEHDLCKNFSEWDTCLMKTSLYLLNKLKLLHNLKCNDVECSILLCDLGEMLNLIDNAKCNLNICENVDNRNISRHQGYNGILSGDNLTLAIIVQANEITKPFELRLHFEIDDHCLPKKKECICKNCSELTSTKCINEIDHEENCACE